MSKKRQCPQCGAERTDDNLSGLCPKCLARYSFQELEGAQNTSVPSDKSAKTIRIDPANDVELERTGMMIGRYKLLEQIGEGGFGLVYMAEQVEPMQRRVALKVIKAGMDTKAVVARFEAERQALAMMDHPNIARVFDAGTTKAGRPYFVMELVRGLPITEFCDLKKLSTAERLNLFMTVCQAVQHAHQKGIIHRDIKPSNVLVTLHDGKPVPKVIDFGVAKALGQRLTDKTLFTGFAHMIGTPAYMSPEQAELSGLDIDTRSDIYSLGVLLYELLIGVTPFDRETLAKAALDEIRRMIRETEPSKPSTRLQTLGEKLTTVAQSRHTDAPKLLHLIKGDLDWIVMKALEKDRARRYETANGLAADIQRHLANEPVTARPPSKLYEFQKTVRRHKFGFAAAGAVMAALLIGTSVATWQALRANTEARKAGAAAARAEEELARANEVKSLIRQMLQNVAPEKALGTDTTLLENILNDTAQRLNSGKIANPLVAAELHWIIGNVYRDLARFNETELHLLKAVATYRDVKGEADLATANVMNDLAITYRRVTRYDEAEKWGSQALAIARKHGDDNLYTVGMMGDLATTYWSQGHYEKSEQLFLESLKMIAKLVTAGRDPNLPVNHLNNLGALYLDWGRYPEAKQRLQESLALLTNLPPESPDVLATQLNLAVALKELGDYEAAEKLNEQILAGYRKVLGESHPRTLAIKVNLAASHLERAKATEDSELLERAKQMFKDVVLTGSAPGVRDSDTHAVINAKANLARIHLEAGDYERAEGLIVEVVEHLQKKGFNPSIILRYQLGLANVYQRQAEATDDKELLAKAKAICQQVIEADSEPARSGPGPNNDALLEAMSILVSIYLHEGNNVAALPLATNLLKRLEDRFPPEDPKRFDDPNRLDCMSKLALIYQRLNEFSTAEEYYQEAIKRMRDNPWVNPEDRLATIANHGCLYLKLGRYEDAQRELEQSVPLMREKLPRARPATLTAINCLATVYANLDHRDQALVLFREHLELQLADTGATPSPPHLNHAARMLLTHEFEELRDPQRALPLAKQACEIARRKGSDQLWKYLDTLALAQHQTGDNAAALTTQQEAIALLPNSITPERRKEFEAHLQDYESATKRAADSEPTPTTEG